MLYQLIVLNILLVLCQAHPLAVNGTSKQPIDELTAKFKHFLQYISNEQAREKQKSFKHLGDGWVTLYSGFRYKKTHQTSSWQGSRDICQAWGGDLAVHGLQNMESRRKLFDALSISGSHTWIGLSDFDEGEWVWVNGEIAISSAILWMPGEPNNKKKEDCGEIVSTAEGGLGTNDESCDSQRFGLCEKKF